MESQMEAPGTRTSAPTVRPVTARNIVNIVLEGWNVWSSRFVSAPTWTWGAIPDVAGYVVKLAIGKQKAKDYKVDQPQFDMSDIWDQLPIGPIDAMILGVGADGTEVCNSQTKSFYKVQGYDGRRAEPLDWVAAVRRNMEYLLAPPRDRVEDFEKGLPRGIWSCMEDSVTGQRWSSVACPCLNGAGHIRSFLTFCEYFPDDEMASEARRQAKVFGDWFLVSRHPKESYCSLFPYSVLKGGVLKEEGYGNTIFRAARLGIVMIALFETFGDEAYLEYARHLANVLAKIQRDDGSWPFRVDPADGSIVHEYTSNMATQARFFGLLEAIEPQSAYEKARRKAIQWIMNNPVKTRRWEGMFEDMPEAPPYSNLENWAVNETINYLVHYREDDQAYLETSEELNRWVEDQFVIWQEGDSYAVGDGHIGNSALRPNLITPTPMVLEQYVCPFPMEAHNGNWLLALLALHRATQKEEYFNKAVAAANAIVRGQQESGAFSTWGFDLRFDRPLSRLNWPGYNACANTALMHCDQYCKARAKGESFDIGLRGV